MPPKKQKPQSEKPRKMSPKQAAQSPAAQAAESPAEMAEIIANDGQPVPETPPEQIMETQAEASVIPVGPAAPAVQGAHFQHANLNPNQAPPQAQKVKLDTTGLNLPPETPTQGLSSAMTGPCPVKPSQPEGEWKGVNPEPLTVQTTRQGSPEPTAPPEIPTPASPPEPAMVGPKTVRLVKDGEPVPLQSVGPPQPPGVDSEEDDELKMEQRALGFDMEELQERVGRVDPLRAIRVVVATCPLFPSSRWDAEYREAVAAQVGKLLKDDLWIQDMLVLVLGGAGGHYAMGRACRTVLWLAVTQAILLTGVEQGAFA